MVKTKPMVGCLLALALAGTSGRPAMAGQKVSLGLILGLVTLDRILAGMPADPSALAAVQFRADGGGPGRGLLEAVREDDGDEASDGDEADLPDDDGEEPEPGAGGTGSRSGAAGDPGEAEVEPSGPGAGATGLDEEPPPGSIWGDLRPLAEEPVAAGVKQGSVSRPMAKARKVFDPARCPGTGIWCPECTGDRGQAPAPLEEPVRPDWGRYGQALATTLVAEAHLAKATALAGRVEDAFCRMVKRYGHPVPRHRKRALERDMNDAMKFYYQMVEEYQVNRRLRATFQARLAEPGWEQPGEAGDLPLKERLVYVEQALKAIAATQKKYLAAQLPKVDARLQGRSGKDSREEEHIQLEPEPRKGKGRKHGGKLRGL